MIEGVEESRGGGCNYEIPEELARMSHTGKGGGGVQRLVDDGQQEKTKWNEDAWLLQAIPQTDIDVGMVGGGEEVGGVERALEAVGSHPDDLLCSGNGRRAR